MDYGLLYIIISLIAILIFIGLIIYAWYTFKQMENLSLYRKILAYSLPIVGILVIFFWIIYVDRTFPFWGLKYRKISGKIKEKLKKPISKDIIISKVFDNKVDNEFYKIMVRKRNLEILHKNTLSFKDQDQFKNESKFLAKGVRGDTYSKNLGYFTENDGKYNLTSLYEIKDNLDYYKFTPKIKAKDKLILINIPKYILKTPISNASYNSFFHRKKKNKIDLTKISSLLVKIKNDINFDTLMYLTTDFYAYKSAHAQVIIITKRDKNITVNILETGSGEGWTISKNTIFKDIENIFKSNYNSDIIVKSSYKQCRLQKDSTNCSFYSFKFIYNYLTESLNKSSDEVIKIICISDNKNKYHDPDYNYLSMIERDELLIRHEIYNFYIDLARVLLFHYIDDSETINIKEIYLNDNGKPIDKKCNKIFKQSVIPALERFKQRYYDLY